eukprot:gene14776-16945_t
MGAAASMQHVYTDAMDWFKMYFDKFAYMEDFRALDEKKDGVIKFTNLRTWLGKKAMDGSFWSAISTNDTIIRIAFMIASKAENAEPETLVAATVTIKTFKDFLIHLFVLSILWVHFKHADEWSEGTDLGTEKLSFTRFKMACRTFSSAQAHETLTDDKIQADFDFLDVNKSGTIEFSEVCRYCANFFDEEFAKQFEIRKTAAMARITHIDSPNKIEDKSLRFIRTIRVSSAANDSVFGADGHEREAPNTFLMNASVKAHKAMDIIGEKIAENAKVAVHEEMRISTEIALGLDAL